MRYRAILRNFERRAPKPRPTIRVRFCDDEPFYIEGDRPLTDEERAANNRAFDRVKRESLGEGPDNDQP
jgi:hypothetical protein